MPFPAFSEEGVKQEGPGATMRSHRSDTLREETSPKDHTTTTTKKLDSFHKLVQDISDALGPTSGLSTPDIDPQSFINLMQGYTSTASTAHQWAAYACSDPSRAYTRNLVSATNPNASIVLLVWNPSRSSPIHDHADAHCVMKVLRGSLQETLYYTPDASLPPSPLTSPMSTSTGSSSSISDPIEASELRAKKQTLYTKNEVTYISDQIGLHRIENPSTTEVAVSLHLYTPPHAANFGFNMFDESTGQKKHVMQGRYFSEAGRRCA